MPRPKTQAERLAVLEREMDEVRSTQQAILSKQDQVLQELSRYRGAFGMALLLFSAIGTALMIFKDTLMLKLGIKG
jgi:hypothetical protein